MKYDLDGFHFFFQISQFKQFMFYLDDAEQITISDTQKTF